MGHFYRDLINKGIEILGAALSDEIMNFSNIVYLYYVLIADMKHPLQWCVLLWTVLYRTFYVARGVADSDFMACLYTSTCCIYKYSYKSCDEMLVKIAEWVITFRYNFWEILIVVCPFYLFIGLSNMGGKKSYFFLQSLPVDRFHCNQRLWSNHSNWFAACFHLWS